MTETGPTFQLVPQVVASAYDLRRGFGAHGTPVLVKGAVRAWPAWERWSFEEMSRLRRADGSQIIFRFQNGLVEQGLTRPPLDLPIGPYLEGLARRAASMPRGLLTGLLDPDELAGLEPGAEFRLDWSFMRSFLADRVYLAQWNVLDDVPALRRDFAIRALWPGWRWTWEYVFMGPEHTVTGLHFDFPNNWFCQVRGTKEVLLFAPDQTRWLSPSRKYDWGATLSDLDITRLDDEPERAARFAHARGWYARVEAGDALFIPRRHWHTVVALEPCISLAVFGLTPWEILRGGVPSEVRQLLHRLHLYRWGECTCHAVHRPRSRSPEPGVAVPSPARHRSSSAS